MTLQSIQKDVFTKLEILFRTSHALTKHGRPFTDFLWQCILDTKKGLDVGNTYRTDKKCKEFLGSIAEIERQELENTLRSAPYISVMCDESTDSAVQEQVIVYVRFAVKGVIHCKFVGVKHVERPNAALIYDCILCVLNEYCGFTISDLKLHLVGFASDGGAVMRGLHNGVSTKLKQSIQPNLVAIHCLAHYLELALKAALSETPLNLKVENLLKKLYAFFHHSPVHRAILKKYRETLRIKFCVPTRVGGTRWVSHTKRALTNVLKIVPALILTAKNLRQESTCNASTAGSCKFIEDALNNLEFFQYIHFFCDVTSILSYFSQLLQHPYLTVAETPCCRSSVTKMAFISVHATN
ncbi:E3 SUMO-protein ligase KIAA1586-like [Bacillus rossius redtenbacheri]|uniref:E3 SUMO-protein ligase KIAA1586-like n=1 Tax=Bacillus rossius redtenbacheri TaxID=93214 RepID=UPI002FDD94DE